MDMLSKFENLIKFVKERQADIILVLVVILLTATSYNLGKIRAYKSIQTPISIFEPGQKTTEETAQNPVIAATIQPEREGSVVASKKSQSKLYHFLWCPGAGQIAEQNKITFTNEATAIAAGYKLASNCKK